MFADLKFRVGDRETAKHQKAWKRIICRPELATHTNLKLAADSQILTIGSCFVNEIRSVLEATDLKLHPILDDGIGQLFCDRVKSNPAWGEWDERVHYQCFTPFTIEQEVRISLGDLRLGDDTILQRRFKGEDVFVDPCRRQVIANRREAALEIRERMNRRMRLGFEQSDLIIMTLGLVEAFKLVGTELYVSEYSRVIGDESLDYVDSEMSEVLESLQRSVAMIHHHFPDKQIMLTVSPIPMARTFSSDDVMTATTRAKSMLRACVDTLVRHDDRIHYWPSYEYAMWHGNAFRDDDRRHVRREIVAEITSAFCEAYFPADIRRQIKTAPPEDRSRRQPGLMTRIKRQLRRAA